MLLGRIDLLEAQLEVARKLEDFNRNALRDLRTELNNAVGYAQLARKQDAKASSYLDKLQLALANMEEVVDGSEALKEKEPGFYHFVLMDIEMPVMNGYEATMRIRKFPNRIRANIPIIALTANVFPEDRERAMNVGMDDFLAKPVSPARLLGSLARFC